PARKPRPQWPSASAALRTRRGSPMWRWRPPRTGSALPRLHPSPPQNRHDCVSACPSKETAFAYVRRQHLPTSDAQGKSWARQVIADLAPATVVDVGPGVGTYVRLARDVTPDRKNVV